MRYRVYESSSPKKILTYFLYVVSAFWVLMTLILGYQFLNENGEKVNKKWGTFVEAIFNQISYLPYLKNDWQSVFYQSFLFDACADYATLNEEGLEGKNCKIITQDYQTYFVSPNGTGKTWSDGMPWGLEDLFFTYDKVIRQNIWNIKPLTAYQEIKVEQEAERIKITFPTSTTDNNYFFTSAILPKHILEHAQYNDYIGAFAANPITSACGKLQPKSNDPQSLVFNLMQCEDTNLAFYQIKNYEDFESFSKSVLEENSTIIDLYANQLELPDYKRQNIVKSELLSFFFNTKSPKMKVRLRRALGGLINAKFYVGEEYGKFFKMYKENLLSHFYSDGSNIQEFINRVSLTEKEDGVQQQDLEDSGVQALKKSISINGVERKFVFYTPKTENTFNLEIKFSNQFESIKIKDAKNNEFSPKNYKKTDKKVIYPLENGKNLNDGLNQYTIIGTIKGKTYTIANIDLYVLANTQQPKDERNERKINVVYYNNLASNFAVKQLRKILEEAKIIDNFMFEQISSPEAMEAKLVMGDYDILVNTITIGMRKDILKILTTNEALVNPSKYSNPNLTNLFKQYSKGPQKTEIAEQINAIFAQDMPFVIVGYPYDFVNIKENLMNSAFGTTGFMYEYNRRNHLYQHATLIQSTEINFEKAKDIKGFLKHLQNKIWLSLFSFTENKENQTEGSGEEKQGESKEAVLKEPIHSNINPSENPFEGLIQPNE